MNARLANLSAGRVVLHLLCLLRNPRRASWHWHGILRELQPANELHGARVAS